MCTRLGDFLSKNKKLLSSNSGVELVMTVLDKNNNTVSKFKPKSEKGIPEKYINYELVEAKRPVFNGIPMKVCFICIKEV